MMTTHREPNPDKGQGFWGHSGAKVLGTLCAFCRSGRRDTDQHVLLKNYSKKWQVGVARKFFFKKSVFFYLRKLLKYTKTNLLETKLLFRAFLHKYP